ncbi:alpha/beta hydrolase [Amycolatopsis sp. A1MSW2902]|uniref:alpha/beta fold hydrolase n=1 Tax=unclassified Amycolatopsis TaxID=2618356 RepID=UPI00106E8DD2|nr:MULTISPECIES: alpha/beta hydrolase [unclassified Amycolatopsis]
MEHAVRTEDGIRLWAAKTGDGEPVVFCHGGPGLWDMMADVAADLSAAATVCRWDQRGCGQSERRGPYSVETTVADLDAVRAHFGWDRVALLGHSWGAQLALRYTLAHPDRVAKLVYVSGTGIDDDSTWHADYERNLRNSLGNRLMRWESLAAKDRTAEEDREYCVLQWSAEFAGRERALEHAEAMADPWFGVNFECNAALNRERWPDLRGQCEGLKVPTLIVDGTADIRPRSAVDSLERALPMVSRVQLPAGHLPWMEDPAGFHSAVSGFLTKEGADSA